MLLPIMMEMPGEQLSLATDTAHLRDWVQNGKLDSYSRILFFLEDDAHLRRKDAAIVPFRKRGWKVKELRTLHPGVHDVYLLDAPARVQTDK